MAATQASLRDLLRARKRVIVAASGGPDSQALLDCLARLRERMALQLVVVGVDHGLRPKAKEELGLASELALRHGLRFEVLNVGPLPPGNVLEAAREARYAALDAYARAHGHEAIALGHNADDQAETMLLHLVRGSGLAGIAGMPARRQKLVRPLLGVTRAEILTHLAAAKISFATDPSNLHPDRARGQIRQHILPVLVRLNPRAVVHMAQAASSVRPEHQLLARMTRRRLSLSLLTGPAELCVKNLLLLPEALKGRAVMLWLKRLGAQPQRASIARVLALTEGPSGRTTCLKGGHVTRRSSALCFSGGRPQRRRALEGSFAPVVLPSELGTVGTPRKLWCGKHRLEHWSGAYSTQDSLQSAKADATTVAFDADRLHVELLLRPWRPGDKIRAFGLDGRAKVSDLFNQWRIPLALRAGWPVLEGQGEILWVAGICRSAVAPLTTKTTRTLWVKSDTDFNPQQAGAKKRLPRFDPIL